jgi:hypothetical protein
MATVIDSLVVQLGLDPKNFNEGQQKALDSLRKLDQEGHRSAKNTEDSSRGVMDAIGALKTEAIGAFAIFAGASGLKEFIGNTVNAGAAVGRLSRAIGVSAHDISAWQGVARQFGGTGEELAASFQQLANVFTAWQVGGPEAPGVMQIFRSINTAAAQLDGTNAKVIDSSKGVTQSYLDLADNLKIIHDLSQDPNLASYLAGKVPGMTPAMFDALIRGSDQLANTLQKVHGWTEAEADAAGKLQQRWDGLKVSTENWGLHALFGTIDFLSNAWDYQISGGRRPWGSGTFSAHAAAEQPNRPVPSASPYRDAIAAVESRGSGGYSALGPVTASGDRAYGRYQVMGNNIGEWTQAALGRRMTPQEFLNDTSAQDKVFDFKFGQYVQKYGNPQDAASAWFTGRPLSQGAGAADITGTTGAEYVRRFNAAGGAGGGGGGGTTVNQTFTGPVNIQAPGGNPDDIRRKLVDYGLKRQAEGNQSFVGGQ